MTPHKTQTSALAVSGAKKNKLVRIEAPMIFLNQFIPKYLPQGFSLYGFNREQAVCHFYLGQDPKETQKLKLTMPQFTERGRGKSFIYS